MREFFLLSKVSFLQMLNSMQVSRGSKKSIGAAGALLLMAFLALYLSGLYSGLLGKMLLEAGLLEFFVPIMSLIAVLCSLVFTLPAASGVMFGAKDSDFLLSLPIQSFYVTLSRMGALYLENLIFAGLWMLPVGICGYRYGVFSDAGGFLRLLVVMVALPFLSSILGGIGGFLMAYVGSRAKHKALIQNVAGFALFAVFFLGSMQINNLTSVLLENRQEAQRIFQTWLLPFGLTGRAMEGWSALLGAFLICAVPYLAVTWLFSTRYRKILSGLNARALGNNYRLGRLEAQGQGKALWKKEVGRLFSTPTYLMNCGISAFLMVALGIWVLVGGESKEIFFGALGKEWIAPLLLLCQAFLTAMIYPSAVSISLEGKTLWILKEAPISPRVLFGAKAGVNLVLSVPALLISTALFVFSGSLFITDGLCMFLVCLALSVFLAVAGLAVNLYFPNLDAGNDMRVIKNSASALISVFGGMVFTALLAGLWAIAMSFLPFAGLCLGLTVLLAALAAAVWKWLTGKGAEIFVTL